MKSSLLLPFLLLFVFMNRAAAQDARSIMEQYQANAQIDFLTSEIEYNNHSKKGRVQNRKLKQYIKRRPETLDCYKLLLQFVEPGDVRGTATLTLQNDGRSDQQWLYLPALRGTKQISPSRRTNRFMGTEMTYEDLNNYLSEPIEEQQYKLLGEEVVHGVDCYVIEAVPSSNSEKKTSGYSKRQLWISKENYSNLKTVFYDKSGDKYKVYEAFGIDKIGNTTHYRPSRVTMKNLKTGNWTEVFYRNMEVNETIEDNLFTIAYLENN